MNSLKSIYRELEGQCLDPSLVYGCETEGEVYEFENDSLSQVCCIESLNETESVFKDTFEMEIKNIACGEYVLLKDNKVAERGSYRKCNEMLEAYIDIYEWINEMSNKLNQ